MTDVNGAAMPFDPSGYKDGLLEPVDMSDFEMPALGGRTIKPYDGEMVWLDAYMDAGTEMALFEAYEALGEDPDNKESFRFMCQAVCDVTLGHSLTDKMGQPIPQFDAPEVIEEHLPSRALFYLVNLIMGTETEGEGGAASSGLPATSSTADPSPTS